MKCNSCNVFKCIRDTMKERKLSYSLKICISDSLCFWNCSLVMCAMHKKNWKGQKTPQGVSLSSTGVEECFAQSSWKEKLFLFAGYLVDLLGCRGKCRGTNRASHSSPTPSGTRTRTRWRWTTSDWTPGTHRASAAGRVSCSRWGDRSCLKWRRLISARVSCRV